MALQSQPCRWFFKVILDVDIREKKLKLPLKFVGLYGGELGDVAKLSVPDGRVWEMEIKREGQNIWLMNGFDKFAQYYSLSHGHQSNFKYKSMSNFSVRIVDKSACETTYPPLSNASSSPNQS